jgi:hypothetical protein
VQFIFPARKVSCQSCCDLLRTSATKVWDEQENFEALRHSITASSEHSWRASLEDVSCLTPLQYPRMVQFLWFS